MIEIFIKINLATFFFIILGSSNYIKKNDDFSEYSYSGVLGIIYFSILVLFINFILPLSPLVNSIIFFFILLISIFFKKEFLFQNYKKLFFYILIFSFFVTIILSFSNSYRPDSGLYHYPFVNILNENKIILGLSNLHFRFGHVSIIQYLSGAFNNHLFGIQGITIPLGLLVVFVIFYLFCEIIYFFKDVNFRTYTLFNLAIIIYCAYKLNRYSEFGNDAPGHAMAFFLISITLKNLIQKNNIDKDILLIASYIFAIKSTLIIYLLVPIFIFIQKKFKNSFNSKNILAIFLLICWCTKNFFISSCILYPMNISCVKSTSWYNQNNSNSVEEVQIRSEAWNKDWPNRFDKDITQYQYVKNFNWLGSWYHNHFLKILKIFIPYVIFIFLLYLIYYFISSKKTIISSTKKNNINFNVFILLGICLVGIISWFLKAPIYRYGYSYIIIFISLLFSLMLNMRVSSMENQSFKLVSSIILILVIIIFVSKQFVRIQKNWTESYVLEPWPKFYGMNKLNSPPKLSEVYIDKFRIYKSDSECMYSKAPCTNLKIDKNLKIINKNNYFIFNF